MSVIVSKNLTKYYGRTVGVRDLTLEVPEGEVFGFLGPNGSGKTTTIRVLVGLLRPTGGAARIFGLDTWRDSHRVKADVGYLPGDLRLYHWLTARSAFQVVGRIRGRDLTANGRRLAEMFDLDLDVRVRTMSRGTRQKLGLVLALVHEPKLLILDEPTSGLDPIMQERLKDHIRGLASRGHTVFFSSHSLSEVQHVCDRVAIVRNGELVAHESLEMLRGRAMREVGIRWDTGRAEDVPAAPDFLEVHHRTDRQWQCALHGSVPELIRWIADKPVADLSIGQPDLDSVFRRYYDDEAVEP